MMKFAFVLIFSLLARAQDIQSIVDRNPFDPDRGKKEEAETTSEEPVLEEVNPEEMPILDGTIILGNTKIAIFSLMDEGQSITARVEMKADGEYDLYLREKKKAPPKKSSGRLLRPSRRTSAKIQEEEKEEDEEEEPKFPLTPIKNGKLAGYTIASIDRDHVQLSGETGSIKIAMFQKDSKKERGGSKQAVAKQPTQLVTRQLPVKDDKQGRPVVKPITRPEKKDKKDFQKREMPRAKSEKPVTREDLKEKF